MLAFEKLVLLSHNFTSQHTEHVIMSAVELEFCVS